MKTSGLITCYNSEPYIADLLLSILNQSCPLNELIIIDDGSTDSTLKVTTDIINNISGVGPEVKILPLGSNTGIANALNTGISQISGNLLFFTGHDDIWERHRVREALLHHMTGCQLFHSNMSQFGALEGVLTSVDDPTLLRLGMLSGNKILAPSVSILFDERIKEHIWFNSKFNYAEDYELWSRLLLTEIKVKHSDQALVRYRVHNNSASSLKNKYQREIAEEVRRVYCSRVFPDLPLSLSANIGYIFGSALYRRKEYTEEETKLLILIGKRLKLLPQNELLQNIRAAVSERIFEITC